MNNQEAMTLLGPGSFIVKSTCVESYDGSETFYIENRNGDTVVHVVNNKEKAESICAILNEAWSRTPQNGEDCCATCHYCVNSNEIMPSLRPCWDCIAPSSTISLGGGPYIDDPSKEGIGCELWMRRIKRDLEND